MMRRVIVAIVLGVITAATAAGEDLSLSLESLADMIDKILLRESHQGQDVIITFHDASSITITSYGEGEVGEGIDLPKALRWSPQTERLVVTGREWRQLPEYDRYVYIDGFVEAVRMLPEIYMGENSDIKKWHRELTQEWTLAPTLKPSVVTWRVDEFYEASSNYDVPVWKAAMLAMGLTEKITWIETSPE